MDSGSIEYEFANSRTAIIVKLHSVSTRDSFIIRFMKRLRKMSKGLSALECDWPCNFRLYYSRLCLIRDLEATASRKCLYLFPFYFKSLFYVCSLRRSEFGLLAHPYTHHHPIDRHTRGNMVTPYFPFLITSIDNWSPRQANLLEFESPCNTRKYYYNP